MHNAWNGVGKIGKLTDAEIAWDVTICVNLCTFQIHRPIWELTYSAKGVCIIYYLFIYENKSNFT